MKQSFIKTLAVSALALSLILGTVLSSFALPINNVNDSYFYDVNGNDASAPLAFTVERVINIVDIDPSKTLTSAFTPSDICYANGYLYILDSLNNRVYILDEQYQPVKTISGLIGDIPDLPKTQADIPEGEEGSGSAGNTQSNKYSLNKPKGIYVP